MANSGDVSALPANSSQLAAQASSFATYGTGSASSPPATVTPLALGRSNNYCVVPIFVLTPISLLAHSASPSTLNVALPSSIIGAASLAPVAWFTSTISGGPWVFSCTGKVN